MCHKKKGFTLIEVLLALFITAILITILSVVFNTGLRSYRQGKDLLEITRKAQLILGQMTRELVGAMVQKDFISFDGTNTSVYFVAPAENSGVIDLCELGYILDGDEIKRHIDPFDGKNKGEYPQNVVNYKTGSKNLFCANIKEFSLQYLPVNSSIWQNNWSKPISQPELPEMVEVRVTIMGEYPKDNPQVRTFTTWIYLPNSTNNP